METTIPIQNLKCGGCAATIKNKVRQLEGVNTVQVDEVEGTVTVSYDADNVLATVKQKLMALGYPEVETKNDLLTQAKSFVSCAVGRMSKDE